MNKLYTLDNGGHGIELDDLRWMDEAYREAFKGILEAYGNNPFILSGCIRTVSGSTVSITEGFVCIGSEVLYMPAQSFPVSGNEWLYLEVSYDPAGQEVFENAQTFDTYQVRRAKVSTGAAPVGSTLFSDAKDIFEIIKQEIPSIGATETLAGNNATAVAAHILLIDALQLEVAQVATEAQQGKIELATLAETISGTDDSRAITPLKLQGKVATTTAKGIVQLATTAEVSNILIADKAITPQALFLSGVMTKTLHKARVYLADFPSGTTETRTIIIPNLGISSYYVFGVLVNTSTTNIATNTSVVWTIGAKTATSFQLIGHELSSGTQTLWFDFIIF